MSELADDSNFPCICKLQMLGQAFEKAEKTQKNEGQHGPTHLETLLSRQIAHST